MSRSTPPGLETPATTRDRIAAAQADDVGHPSDLLPTHVDLGTDREHYVHHLDRAAGVVHRVDPRSGRRERVTDLDARNEPEPDALAAYMAFVASDVGWLERRYVDVLAGAGR
jgi:hypothetical protein